MCRQSQQFAIGFGLLFDEGLSVLRSCTQTCKRCKMLFAQQQNRSKSWRQQQATKAHLTTLQATLLLPLLCSAIEQQRRGKEVLSWLVLSCFVVFCWLWSPFYCHLIYVELCNFCVWCSTEQRCFTQRQLSLWNFLKESGLWSKRVLKVCSL